MTYGNAKRLCFGLALLSCSSFGSNSGAFAAAENISSTTPVQTLPSIPAPPTGGTNLRPKAAAIGPAKPVEKAAPAPVVSISQDPRPTLDASTFINTMRAAWTYKRIAETGGWPSLPAGTVLKTGDKGPLVEILRQRLASEGDLSADLGTGTSFDAELANAVRRFQARHGLPESGAVRARTLEALNVQALTRHRQLTASAQRLAGSTFSFGERYVVVNIPSTAVEAVERGQVARRFVAIAGKVDRPSPAVETRVTAVNLNPTWTVPVSLIKKDIIPHVQKDPSYLEKMKIRILDAKGQAAPRSRSNQFSRADPHRHAEQACRLHARHAQEAALRPGCALSFLGLRSRGRCGRFCRMAATRHQWTGRTVDERGDRYSHRQRDTSRHPS
jgi:peptidoglycan hydrolase-like protein with peptidoglycan-binding domain